jgi:membrane protein DedA with SNARE-associated domain
MGQLAAGLVAMLIGHEYIVIVAITLLEEAGVPLPVPGDALLMLAGYLAASGSLSFLGCFFGADFGAIAGASVLYWVARRGGRPLVVRYGRILRLREERLDQLARLFRRLGPFGPGICRLVPGLRIYTSALAGLAVLPYPLFLFNLVWACSAWVIIFLGLGDVVGARWREYSQLSQQFSLYAVVGIALLAGAWWLSRQLWQRGSR